MGTNTITYLDRTFDAHDVISGNAYYARPLTSASLEIDTFSFDVQSDDTSLTEFIRNTPLTFYHDGNQMGIFYVQTISRTSINTYHFTCTSTVGLLDETYHDGGIYTGETVREVCTDICKPLTCYVKSNIANIKLYGWLPIATRRENLAQVLFAIGATLKVDYNGAIRIEGLWDGQSSEITASEMYAGGSVEYATPVTEVIVTEHAYSQSTTEVTELFNGTTSAGDKITFDDPCYDLEATGFAITESGANYAIVTAGSGVLNGKKYTHVTRQIITPTNTRSRSLVKQSDNTVKVENATLVSLVNANAVAERLAEYYSHNERINNKIAIKRETPGDVVQIAHPYGGEVTGCVESADVTVSGKLAAQESVLVGYKPQDIGEQEYYDTVEVLTEDGTWTVPDGVTNLRVVLIGGGAGGDSGERGENGESTDEATNSNGSLRPGKGGKGGKGGSAGRGGKVYTVELKVSPNDKFDVEIGAKGVGGEYSPDSANAGTAGADTSFDVYTSKDGAATPNGFTEPTTGITYGVWGTDGIAGADGGDGGTPSTTEKVSGSPGNDVLTYIGGKGGTGVRGNKSNGTAIGGSGGGGGGAAYGANGSDGGNAIMNNSGLRTIHGYTGGNGGIPNAIIAPAIYGAGGHGGHGGGGGGGVGTVTLNAVYSSESGGTGGAGTSGTDGAPGCVLIYYRRPKSIVVSGAFHDRNGKTISDKYGRRLVV